MQETNVIDKLFDELNADAKEDIATLAKYQEDLEKIHPKLHAVCTMLLLSARAVKEKPSTTS